MPQLSIGQLSNQTGETVKTLRYWTDTQLLDSTRGNNGYRYYHPNMAQRVTFIRNTQTLGFKLREIKSIIDLRAEGIKPCEDVRTDLATHLQTVQHRIRELQQLETDLTARLNWANTHPNPDCDTEGCVYLTKAA